MPLAELQRDLSQGLEFLKLVRGGRRGNRKKAQGLVFASLMVQYLSLGSRREILKLKLGFTESILETWPGKINVLPSIPLLEGLGLCTLWHQLDIC